MNQHSNSAPTPRNEAPTLAPCPFCASPLSIGRNRVNPHARCVTDGCFGNKMPVVNLDVPSDVVAWNTRTSVSVAATTADTRPIDCRNRLRDEGQSYPKSGCAVCRTGGLTGCPYEKPGSPTNANPAADRMIGEIEKRFPDWKSYRDLIDCIDCTLLVRKSE